MCRGACGPDCTRNNCTLRGTGRCESDPAGRQTGNWVTANVYSCGTHQACREHDDCYDTCNNGRCDSWAAASCRRKCDLDTVSKWPAPAPYWWARGYGSFDNHIDFEYPDPPRYDPLLCPLKGGGLDASADGSTDLRNADVPSGTPDAGRPDASVVPDVSPDWPEDTAKVQDAPIMNTWRMTNCEVVLEPHTDGCYKMLSSANGQAQAAGDCLYYDGKTFTETDTFTWTASPPRR